MSHKRFKYAFGCVAVVAALILGGAVSIPVNAYSASPQQPRTGRARRRGAQQPKRARPARPVGYVRISTAGLFEEVGYIRKGKGVLAFGDKVYLTEQDFSDDSEYAMVTDADTGQRGLVNKLAITRTLEEVKAIKESGLIPNRLIRVKDASTYFAVSFEVSEESHIIGSPREFNAGDAVYLPTGAKFTEDVCRSALKLNRIWQLITTMCEGLKENSPMMVYYYDGKTFKEWGTRPSAPN